MDTLNFQDWQSFLALAERRNPINDNGGSFTGTRSYSDAVQLAYSGWLEVAERCRKYSAGLFDRVSTLIERHDIRYDVTGSGLDVARYLEGEPECWQNFEPVLVESPSSTIVRICFNGTVSAGISGEVIESKGAAIAALVELLEFAGRRVELSAVFSNSSRRQRESDTLVLTVKTAEQPLDMPRIAYVLAHKSMLRRLMFAYWEGQPIYKIVGAGFGVPRDYKPATADIYIPQSTYRDIQWDNPAKAEKFILDQLQAQGITLQSNEVRP